MLLIVLFALEGVIVLLGTLGLGWWLRRRYATRWGTWVWGAIAFAGSQILRIPLLVLLTALLPQLGFRPDQETAFWFNLIVLALTSGLFEETARYAVLRWLDKGSRGWRAALMFGAGHGGIEAILIIVPTMINNIVLLSGGDALVQATQAISPDQAAQLAAALETLRSVSWWLPGLAVWERVAAITFHISAAILVMRAVMGTPPRPLAWWGLAVLFHTAINAFVLVAQRYGGVVMAELMSTVSLVIALYVIRRLRPPADAVAESIATASAP
jgi:uncharacterized membrane protein YhfC